MGFPCVHWHVYCCCFCSSRVRQSSLHCLYFYFTLYLTRASHFSYLPLLITYTLLFSIVLLPSPNNGHDLFSWCLKLLHNINSHLKIFSYEPQIRKKIQHLLFWVWVALFIVVISSSRRLPENFLISIIYFLTAEQLDII